jgi:uncharacterized membrane protein
VNNVQQSAAEYKPPVIQRLFVWLARHWLLTINVLLVAWVGLPWLAPVFMHSGWTSAADVIYFIYALQCHQLPQRSFFLFGEQVMYTLPQIQSAWPDVTNPFVLRQFVGNHEMGWKVAWSDRMVYAYTSISIGGLLYGMFRQWVRPLNIWAFFLLLMPIALDGGTHMISDFAGIGQGFRDTNAWLQMLTRDAFPAAFYQGDMLGSFNSWMRLLTGLPFGLGIVAFLFPRISAEVE